MRTFKILHFAVLHLIERCLRLWERCSHRRERKAEIRTRTAGSNPSASS